MALAGAAARAGDIATYPALACEKYCSQVVPATPTQPLPDYFQTSAKQAGFVDLSFVVGIDGHARDIFVERAVGPHALVGAALDSLANTLYKPALEDGAPVAESKRYRFAFSSGHDDAATDADDTDCNDAVPATISGTTISELLVNARCVAQREARAGNYAVALKASRIATIDDGHWLAPETRVQALRLRVELEAQAGEVGEALTAFATLQKVDEAPLLAGDSDVSLMSRIYLQIDSDKPLTTAGVIMADGGDLLWHHVLFRRTFSFSDVTGTLDRFTLRCGTHSFSAPYIDKGAWNVPAHWGGCMLYVFGSPNATFNLVESSEPAIARETVKR